MRIKHSSTKESKNGWNVGPGAKTTLFEQKALRFSAMVVGRSPGFSTVSEFERWHSWVDLPLYYKW